MNTIQPTAPFVSSPIQDQKGLMFTPFGKFEKLQPIYEQGSGGYRLFRVKTGLVKIVHLDETGNQFIREIKSEGEVFGEWRAIFDVSTRHKNSAVTLTEGTEVLSLNLYEVEISRLSTVISDFTQIIIEENEKQQIRHQMLRYKSAEYRIKEVLRELAVRAGQRFGDETLLKVWLSHEDIGLLAGCTRQTVTTVMNELKNNGKIIYSRDRILFRNINQIHN